MSIFLGVSKANIQAITQLSPSLRKAFAEGGNGKRINGKRLGARRQEAVPNRTKTEFSYTRFRGRNYFEKGRRFCLFSAKNDTSSENSLNLSTPCQHCAKVFNKTLKICQMLQVHPHSLRLF
jgi:hypothetical protein